MLYYGLLLSFVLDYVRPSSYVPALDALHLNSLVPLVVVMGSVFWSREVPNRDVLRSTNARLIMFLLFLIGLSILTAEVTLYAYNVFVIVVGYFLMFFAIRKQVYDLDRIKGVFKVLVLVHLAVGLLTPQIVLQPEVRHYLASGAFLGDGNDFALSVNIAIPCCMFLMLEARTVYRKVIYTGALIAMILAVIGTQSRGGTLALACIGLYYWMKSDRKLLGIVGLVFVVGLVLYYAPPTYFERIQTLTLSSEERDGSAQGRILAWRAGVRMAADHPLLGVGAGHFPVKYGVEYRPPGYGRTEIPWQTAHSNYFVILGELGFPGLLFLLVFLWANFLRGGRVLRELKGNDTERALTYRRLVMSLNASLVAFTVGGAFLTAIYYPHLYVLAALLECGRALSKEAIALDTIDHKPTQDAQFVYRGAPA